MTKKGAPKPRKIKLRGLTPSERKEYLAVIDRAIDELKESLGITRDIIADTHGSDRATAGHSHNERGSEEQLNRNRNITEKRDLRRLDALLERRARVVARTFEGVCADCRIKIPVERLHAVPETGYCTTHAAAHEKK